MQVKGAYFFLSGQCFTGGLASFVVFSGPLLSFFFFTLWVKKKERGFGEVFFRPAGLPGDRSAETALSL